MSASSSFRSADISSAETLQASYDSNGNQILGDQGNITTSMLVLSMSVDSDLRVRRLSVTNSSSRSSTHLQHLHVEDNIVAVDGILVRGLQAGELEQRLSKSSVILRVVRGQISVYVSCNLKRIPLSSEAQQTSHAQGSQVAGIGITLQRNAANNEVQISHVHPGGPASKIADIEVGDRVLAVGAHKVDDLEIEEIRQLIIGPEGTEIDLKLERQPPPPRQVKYKFRVKIRRGLVFSQDSTAQQTSPRLPSTIDLTDQEESNGESRRNIILQYIVMFHDGSLSQQRISMQKQNPYTPNRKSPTKRIRNKAEKGKNTSDFLPSEPVRFYTTNSRESSREPSMDQGSRNEHETSSKGLASEWDTIFADMEPESLNLSSSMQSTSSLQHSEEIFWPHGRSVLFADRRLDPGIYDSEDDCDQEDMPAIEESLDLQWVQVDQDSSRAEEACNLPLTSTHTVQEDVSLFFPSFATGDPLSTQDFGIERSNLDDNDAISFVPREPELYHGQTDETLEKVTELLERMQAKFQDIDNLTRRVKGTSSSLPM